MGRKVEMVLEYQNYIETPPIQPRQLYGNACSSDTITIDTWRPTWIRNIEANHKRFGSFKEYGLGQLFGKNQNKPAIIVGSGPSLMHNGALLKDRGEICALSCLHNYHFFEDNDVAIDYYVTLDAGAVVLEELSEGGKKTEAEYWESTKDKTVLAFIGTDPAFFDKWQGKVYLFGAPIGDPAYEDALRKLEVFNCHVSNGGNVLGACLYIAKAFLGSNPIAFVGADFSFGYNTGTGHHFHGWDSKYDAKLGNVMRAVDIYGNKVLTWPSYFNFKNFFDFVALQVPGLYINCTEGGMFGAYPEGNLMAVRQMTLDGFLHMYKMNEALRAVCADPTLEQRLLLY